MSFVHGLTFLIVFLNLVLYVSSNFINDGSLAHTKKGAIVLTMAGQGVPPYLQWSCLSAAGTAGLFDMLIFHEDNEKIISMKCAHNVKKINLGRSGLATIITKTLVENLNFIPQLKTQFVSSLNKVLDLVLQEMPYFLAEFKIASGAIFEEYIRDYTHWTYTDPDIMWGNLSKWISPMELEEYDIITFGKINDVSRLFLRGQFALHKNQHELNNIWRKLAHLKAPTVLEKFNSVITAIGSGNYTAAMVKRLFFQSAEGAYSSLVLNDKNLVVLIAGRMFSDRIIKPVVWTNGELYRCVCPSFMTCARSFSEDSSYCIVKDRESTAVELLLSEESVKQHGCGMGWLNPEHRLCLSRRDEKGIIFNEVIFKHGKWYLNDERQARRARRQTSSMFHFRIWEDELSSRLIQSNPDVTGNCFIIFLSRGTATLHFHNCNDNEISQYENQASVEMPRVLHQQLILK